jgi:hypothetical protein
MRWRGRPRAWKYLALFLTGNRFNELELLMLWAYPTVSHLVTDPWCSVCIMTGAARKVKRESQSMPEAANDIIGRRWGNKPRQRHCPIQLQGLEKAPIEHVRVRFRGLQRRKSTKFCQKGYNTLRFPRVSCCSVAESCGGWEVGGSMGVENHDHHWLASKRVPRGSNPNPPPLLQDQPYERDVRAHRLGSCHVPTRPGRKAISRSRSRHLCLAAAARSPVLGHGVHGSLSAPEER